MSSNRVISEEEKISRLMRLIFMYVFFTGSQSSYKGKQSSRSKRLSSGSARKSFQQVQSSSSEKEQPMSEYIPLKATNSTNADKLKDSSTTVTTQEDNLTATSSPVFVFPKIDANPGIEMIQIYIYLYPIFSCLVEFS